MSRSFVVFLTLLVFSSMAFSIDVSSCQVISAPGTYDLINSFSGAPNPYYSGAYDSCILINNTNNVILDCHGYTITGSGGTAPTAIAIEDSAVVTIQNCDLAGQWGLTLHDSNGSTIQDNNVTASWAMNGLGTNPGTNFYRNDVYGSTYGFFNPASDSNYVNNTASAGSVAYYGGYNSTFEGNYAYDSPTCFNPSSYANMTGNDAYNCSTDCFYTTGTTVVMTGNTGDLCGTGARLRGASYHTLTGNEFTNSDIGIYLQTYFSEGVDYAFYNTLNGNDVHDNNVGIGGYYAVFNNLSGNDMYDNDYAGLSMNYSAENNYVNNDAYGNDYGFILSIAENETLSGNDAYSNDVRGFSLSSVNNSDLTGNDAYLNSDHGYQISSSYFNRLTGNDALNNGNSGIMVTNSNYNNLTGNNCSSNSNEGIRLFTSTYNRMSGNELSGNNHGLWLSTNSDFNTLYMNDAYSNGNTGFYLFSSQYTNITGNTLHDNSGDGIEIYWNSNDAQLFDNEIYDNSAYGVQLRDSSKVALHNDHLYQNGNDLGASGTSLNLDYTMDGVVFDSDGTYTDYTNISLSDATNDTYVMDWDNQPGSLPFPMVSFNQKFINITDTGSADTIDDIVWHWNNAELGSFDESMLQLWEYDGSWSLVNGTPDTVNNEFAIEDLSGFSTFAILAGGACPTPITSAGTYTLTGDLEGSTNDASPIVGTACIKIASSDVIIDCDGYSITNNGTAGTTHAIVSNGTFTNVTVRNCPNMADYRRAVFYYQTSNGAILNSNAYNNTDMGFLLNTASNNNIVENCSAVGNGYAGFYLSNSDNNNLTDTHASSNSIMGYFIQNSDYNRFVDSTADNNNNADGFRVTTSTGDVFLNCNASGPNQDYGFHLEGGSGHNLTSCTALQNDIGFYTDSSNSNFFIDVNGSLGDDGLRMESSTGNLVDPSYFCDNDRQGVYLLNSNSNTVTDSTMCRNGDSGVYLEGSSNNDIYRNDAYDNTGNGFRAGADSDNNDFINNTAYGTTGGNGFSISQAASSGNVLSGNVAYENALCGFIAFQSPGNTFNGNTAYDNGERGFRIFQGNDNVLMDNTAYGQTGASFGNGLSIYESNNTVVTNDHYYGNAAPDVLIDGSGIMATLNNVIIDSDAGTFTNYSNVSVDDLVASAYSLEWAAEPAPLPVNYRSFNGKYLEVTNLTTGVSIDRLAMHWLETELLPDYTEGDLRLVFYDGAAWNFMNTTPDEANNELSYEAITESTTIGIIEFTGIEDTDDGSSTEDELQISFSGSCEGNVITIKSNGNEVGSASVQVFHKTSLTDIATGSTDSNGEFTFVGCGIPVKILASKTGYQSANTIKTLIACSECDLECGEDADCSDKEECKNNLCQRVDCSCGYIESHACNPYECCQDSDCEALQACVENSCVDNYDCTSNDDCEASEYCNIAENATAGFCEDVTGLCGEAEDHEWVQYECGDEEGCPDCPAGYACDDNLCEPIRDLDGPDSGFVGDNVTVNATEAGGVCADCEVQIKLPDGKILNGRTDGKGNLMLPLNLEGSYEITLLKDGVPIETIKVNALPRPVVSDDEPETQVLDDLANVIFLVLLLAVLFAGVIYWRRGKKK